MIQHLISAEAWHTDDIVMAPFEFFSCIRYDANAKRIAATSYDIHTSMEEVAIVLVMHSIKNSTIVVVCGRQYRLISCFVLHYSCNAKSWICTDICTSFSALRDQNCSMEQKNGPKGYQSYIR